MDAGATATSADDFGKGDEGIAARWKSELDLSDKFQKVWLARAKRIIRRYEQEPRSENGKHSPRYAILWSNQQTLGPAIYARTPKPEVSRRFKDADPVGRAAAEVLERALMFQNDTGCFDSTMKSARDSYLLIARGVAWVRYEAKMGNKRLDLSKGEDGKLRDVTDKEYEGDTQEDDDGVYGYDEQVEWETTPVDYVNYDDFGTNSARHWQEVRFVYRRAFMTREQLIDRFGEEVGKAVPLDWKTTDAPEKDGGVANDQFKKATIYEIWDKPSRQVFFISRHHSVPLQVVDDPLGLEGFFPCPEPLVGTQGPTTIMPVPDYEYYRDQADELDELTERIGKLTDALKVCGFYPGQYKDEIGNVLNPANENMLIPVESWAVLKDNGGARGLIEWFPVEQVVVVIKGCYEARRQVLEDIYQITGISDIVRGATDPNETATAQGIKSQWGSLRVRDRQKEIARFARDILRITGEVIAEKFSIETLRAMTGVQLPTREEQAQAKAMLMAQQQRAAAMAPGGPGMAPPPPAPGQPPAAAPQPAPPPMPPIPPDQLQKMQDAAQAPATWEDVKELLESDAMRQFRIDIEADSTIEPDEQMEKQQATEFAAATGQFFSSFGPLVAQAPQLAPFVGEMFKFVARRFRVSTSLEDSLDKALDQIAQAPPQPPPGKAGPPPPDPADQQAKMMMAQAKMQDAQTGAMQAQQEAQYKQGDLQLRQQELQIKAIAEMRDPEPQVTA